MAYSIDLSGRVAFITGASSGLGAQFARTLARAGAGVVLASRRIEKLKELRARIEGEGGDAHVIELDVTDHDSIKAAVVQMTRAMAMEWGKFGINTNAICPGYIDTEINHHHWDTEQGQKLIAMLPRKRVGSPQDLDALLVMLASDQSHFINGAVIAADDGFAV